MGKEQFLTVPNRLGHHTSKWKESEQDPELLLLGLPIWILNPYLLLDKLFEITRIN